MAAVEDAVLRAVAAHGRKVAAVEQTLESMVHNAHVFGTLTDQHVVDSITRVFVGNIRELNKDPFYSAAGLLERIGNYFRQQGLQAPEQFMTAVKTEVEAQSKASAAYYQEMLRIAKGARLNE